MAAQALERVKNHFTVQDAVTKTINIYERLRVEESR
jgi:hypothetical protein